MKHLITIWHDWKKTLAICGSIFGAMGALLVCLHEGSWAAGQVVDIGRAPGKISNLESLTTCGFSNLNQRVDSLVSLASEQQVDSAKIARHLAKYEQDNIFFKNAIISNQTRLEVKIDILETNQKSIIEFILKTNASPYFFPLPIVQSLDQEPDALLDYDRKFDMAIILAEPIGPSKTNSAKVKE